MKKITTIEYVRAIIYCRVSSDQQVKDGHGLDSQEQRCIAYAQNKKLEVAEIFRDEGISGKLFDRPAMQNLIAYLDKHPSEKFVIIFDDLARFSRDVPVHFQLKTELVLQRKAKLECLNFNFEDSPAGRYVELIMVGAGQLQREQNTEQVKNKMKARLELGYWPFCPPPGLINVKDSTGKRIKPLARSEPFASIYKEAIEKYKDYKLNTLEEVRNFILQEYKIQGIKRPLSLHGVKGILTCSLYAGYIEYKPWGIDLRQGHHEGFITYETYLAVQEKLANKAKPRLRKDYSEDFPLRNYLLCPHCQRPQTASWHRNRWGSVYSYYWCKTSDCGNKNKTVLTKQVHDDFINVVNQLIPENRVLELAIEVFNDIWKEKQKGVNHENLAVKKELKEVETKISSFMERIGKTTSDIMIKQYEAELEKLVNKKSALEADFNKASFGQEQYQEAFNEVVLRLINPLKVWNDPDYKEKRLLLGMYFEQGIVYTKNFGFGTPVLPLIVKTISQKHITKSAMVEMPGVKPGSKTFSSPNYSQD